MCSVLASLCRFPGLSTLYFGYVPESDGFCPVIPSAVLLHTAYRSYRCHPKVRCEIAIHRPYCTHYHLSLSFENPCLNRATSESPMVCFRCVASRTIFKTTKIATKILPATTSRASHRVVARFCVELLHDFRSALLRFQAYYCHRKVTSHGAPTGPASTLTAPLPNELQTASKSNAHLLPRDMCSGECLT